MKITSASKKVLASALSAAMVVAFAPTAAFAAVSGKEVTADKGVVSVKTSAGLTKYFDKLDKALEVAAAGDTVTLLGDITTDAEADVDTLGDITSGIAAGVTFLGDGYTISTDADSNTVLKVAAGTEQVPTTVSNVTLKATHKTAGKVDKTFSIQVDKTVQTTTDVDDYATISSVTADGIDITANASGKDTYTTISGTTVTTLADTEKATVESGSYKLVTVAAGAATTIKDGSFGSVENKGTLTIKGGTFASYVDDEHAYHFALENGDSADKDAAAKTTIKNGSFTGNILNNYIYSTGTTPLTKLTDAIEITGGTFIEDVSDFVGANVVCTPNADKTVYTVGTGLKTATVTDSSAVIDLGNAATEQGAKAVEAAAKAWMTDIQSLKLTDGLILGKDVTVAALYQQVVASTLR